MSTIGYWVLVLTLQSSPNEVHEVVIPSNNLTKAECIALAKGIEKYQPNTVWGCVPDERN